MQRWSGLYEKQIAAACGYIAVLLFFDYEWDARYEVDATVSVQWERQIVVRYVSSSGCWLL